MARHPKPGELAPDFDLEGTAGRFRLSEQLGTAVVLVFYPADKSLVCTKQLCAYRDRGDELAALGALVVGISPQDVASHERFSAAHALAIPLLADIGGAVARSYAVRSRLGGTRRATFVIDTAGVVRYRHENPLSLTYDSVKDIRRAVESLP